jgi:chaperonin cofactor prefoldin
MQESIEQLKNKIEDLELKLSMEKQVKESEVMLNKELKERIEKFELHIETLIKINENYSNTIGRLRAKLKDLIVK